MNSDKKKYGIKIDPDFFSLPKPTNLNILKNDDNT